MTHGKELMTVDRPPGVIAMEVMRPNELTHYATQIAKELANVVEQQRLYQNIQGKKYVMVEGWTTMGAMLGIVPAERSVEQLPDGSFIASVDLIRLRDGMKVGGASALCGMDEKRWGTADVFARRSMAITRATGKAYRLGYSWIMKLAGYEPTPQEEMPESMKQAQRPQRPQPTQQQVVYDNPPPIGDDDIPFDSRTATPDRSPSPSRSASAPASAASKPATRPATVNGSLGSSNQPKAANQSAPVQPKANGGVNSSPPSAPGKLTSQVVDEILKEGVSIDIRRRLDQMKQKFSRYLSDIEVATLKNAVAEAKASDNCGVLDALLK